MHLRPCCPKTTGRQSTCGFDTRERPKAGHRSREWTAVARSELEVVREMARCLRLIGEGEVPD